MQRLLATLAALALPTLAHADTVTDWDELTVRATKGYDGAQGTSVALDSNLSTRIEAVVARAVFDAVNAIDHFSDGHYYYEADLEGSVDAAVAQATHDVLLGLLPNPSADATIDAKWNAVRGYLDVRLASALANVAADDGGISAGKASAAAALAARKLDGAAPVTTFGAQLVPTSNPGIGIWRQSNAAAAGVDPTTGAPTGFDANGVIQGRPGIDSNWRDVTPFALTTQQKTLISAAVPQWYVGSPEYAAELDFVKRYGQNSSSVRSADQTAQALYYKQDIEIVIHEAARVASAARKLTLDDNAKLFALLNDGLADARFAAFDSKWQLKFWRPITAINADAKGAVSAYTWKPLAATPSHASNTAGHAATGAAGFELLRAFFKSDQLRPDGAAVTLGTLPWLVGTNAGTGNASTRSISTFSQAQLENGASRVYLGVHFGYDILQGQLLGLETAKLILRGKTPAAEGVKPFVARASLPWIVRTISARPDLYGYFAKSPLARD